MQYTLRSTPHGGLHQTCFFLLPQSESGCTVPLGLFASLKKGALKAARQAPQLRGSEQGGAEPEWSERAHFVGCQRDWDGSLFGEAHTLVLIHPLEGTCGSRTSQVPPALGASLRDAGCGCEAALFCVT